MGKYFTLFLSFFLLMACKAPKVIEREVYKDSLIYTTDTIAIDVPYEKVVWLVPALDTLKMETSVAKSTTWLDTTTCTLKGELENKKVQLEKEIEIAHHYKVLERTVTLEKTKYITKTKNKIPRWVWYMVLVLLSIVIGQNYKKLLKVIKLFL